MIGRAVRAAARTSRVGGLLALAGIAGASTVGFAPFAGTAAASGGIIVSEAVSWGNGGPSYDADWFEITNTSASAVDISGWRFDDNSNSFASSVALMGVTSIAPGESVVFVEGTTSTATTFVGAWFGVTAPAGFQIGTYSGSGISFGNGGDAVNIFDAGGTLRANITFGAGTNFRSFDNAAGVDNGAVSTLSTAGVNGAFSVVDNGNTTIASPGSIANAPGTTTTTSTTTTTIVSPPTGVLVTEVAPWSSGNSSIGVDWFEVHNPTGSSVNVAGWKVDDSSHGFGTAILLTGITSIAPGESVIYMESGTPATTIASFVSVWFGGNAPAGLQFGTYSGSGIGLSTGGDEVNLYDSTGTLQASVAFGASPAASPFASFDNAAGLTGAISALSTVGVNGAYSVADTVSGSPVTLIGSPGTIVTDPSSTTTSGPTTTAAPTTTAPAGLPWPGDQSVTNASTYVFGGNMSGLIEDSSGVLWGVRNGPGALFRLVWDGTMWVPDSANGWTNGKLVHYPTGTGDADAEGVTFTGAGPGGGLYISTERNNTANTISRNVIIRVNPADTGTELTADAEWNITADIPATGANLGLEAITWVPDTYLVAQGFHDTSLNKPYDPADHPNHGDGLFFVGVEATGAVHVYALDMAGTNFTRVATFASGFPGIMDLQFDRDLQQLWAVCDNTCNGRHSILRISNGAFVVSATFARPTDMPNLNNEGFAIAPATQCVGDRKPVWWADDGETGGISIRGGSIPCTAYVDPGTEVPEFPVVVLPAVLALGGLVVATRRRRPVATA